MSVAIESRAQAAGVPKDDLPYALGADQFLGMIELGIFPKEARVYLRDGEIYEKMAKTRAHSVIGSAFDHALHRHLPQGWTIFPEGQFKLDEANAVLPDFAVVRGGPPLAFLAPGRYPGATEIGLLVEIAVTSLAKDLGAYLERYARAAIPAYWVAHAAGRRIYACAKPEIVSGRGVYAEIAIIEPGGNVPFRLDGREIARIAYEELLP